LLYRSDRDYLEAIKAYKQALKIDPENLQILRDLSMLQIQMRDLSGFQVTRNTILTLKPNGKINWMAFALAKHMLGDLEDAVKVIDIYLGTLTEGSPELGRCFEAGELAMYRNMILAEIPDNYRQALNHLAVCEGIVLDRGAWLMTRGEYQLKLKDFVAARQSALLMFQRGMTENHKAHSMYMCAVLELQDEAVCDEALKLAGTNTLASMLPLTDEQTKTISEAYQSELVPHYLHSHAVQRIPYQLLKGEELGKALDIRCRKDLTKGVPSLCSELISYVKVVRKGRYVQPDDPFEVKSHPVFQMLAAMVEEYIVCLTSESKFSKEDEVEEAPSSLLWALYLRAGLHEHAGEYAEGIALLDKCLEHTPTAVDVYDIKSRLIKKSGDINAAVECIDKGRDLDRQDRYINNQTTKYMLQAGMEAEGLKRISLFTRHEGNAEQNLFDMQCSWYELELAACLSRKGEWGKSLKKYGTFRELFVCSSLDCVYSTNHA
jgi:tetratricopeptide (TPR) repeat protein